MGMEINGFKKRDWCRRQSGEAAAVLENQGTELGVQEGEFKGLVGH